MAYEQREGCGTLFKNRNYEEGGNKPYYRGDILINGTTMEIAAWVKEGKNGKFLSLKATPKEEQRREYEPAPEEGNSDVPF